MEKRKLQVDDLFKLQSVTDPQISAEWQGSGVCEDAY